MHFKEELGKYLTFIDFIELNTNGFKNIKSTKCCAEDDARHLRVPVQFFDVLLTLVNEKKLRRKVLKR